MTRRKARKLILQALFQQDFREARLEELLPKNAREDAYINESLKGIEQHRAQIDQLISKYARGWRLERIFSVDRNILRMAIYELLCSELPGEVVINEAVELAKTYGTEHSHIFINGILDRIWKEVVKDSSQVHKLTS